MAEHTREEARKEDRLPYFELPMRVGALATPFVTPAIHHIFALHSSLYEINSFAKELRMRWFPRYPYPPVACLGIASQVAFCMIRQESGKLPLTRYEIRVEEDLENEGAAGLSSSQSNVASMPSTTQSKTIWGDALGGRQGSIGLEKNSVTSIGKPKAGLTHSKPSSSSACYGGNEGQMPLTDQPSSGENGGSCAKEDSDGGDDSGVRIVELMLVPASRGNVIAKPSMTSAEEEERKLVTVRGLKPSTRYRVKVRYKSKRGVGCHAAEILRRNSPHHHNWPLKLSAVESIV